MTIHKLEKLFQPVRFLILNFTNKDAKVKKLDHLRKVISTA